MKANYLPHLAGRVFGVPLLIQPQKLSVILQAIGPRLGVGPAEIEIEGLGAPLVARMPADEEDDCVSACESPDAPRHSTTRGASVMKSKPSTPMARRVAEAFRQADGDGLRHPQHDRGRS